jgi:hypothetical protein
MLALRKRPPSRCAAAFEYRFKPYFVDIFCTEAAEK